MKIAFKAHTVEELQAEVVGFIRFRAEQELSNGKALDRTLTDKSLTQARAKAFVNLANIIAEAELLKPVQVHKPARQLCEHCKGKGFLGNHSCGWCKGSGLAVIREK